MGKTRIDIHGIKTEIEAEEVLEKAVTKIKTIRETKHELPEPVLRESLEGTQKLLDKVFEGFLKEAESILSK